MTSFTDILLGKDSRCHHRIWTNTKTRDECPSLAKKETAASYNCARRCGHPNHGHPSNNRTSTHQARRAQESIRLEWDDNNKRSCNTSTAPLVIAEAHVTMKELVEFTLSSKQHEHMYLLPKVVAEFPNITVGGAIAGGGVESSSGTHGIFADTVAWVKVGIMGTSHLEIDDVRNDDVRNDEADISGASFLKTITVYRGDELWSQISCTFGASDLLILEAAIECVCLTSRTVKVSYYDFATTAQACQAMTRLLRKISADNAVVEVGVGDEHVHAPGGLCFVDALQLPREYNVAKYCDTVLMVGRISGTRDNGLSCRRDREPERKVAGRFGWRRPVMGGSFYYEHVLDLVKRSVACSVARDGDGGSAKRQDNDRGDEDTLMKPFTEEVLDIVDYLFRYDAGAFWMARPMAFQWRKVLSFLPFTLGMFVMSHRWVRSFFTGWLFCSSSRLYRMLQLAPQSVIASKLILQDFYVPAAEAPKFIRYIRTHIPLSVPIWICPVRSNQNQPFTPCYCGTESAIFLNCGVYGRVPNTRGQEYTQQLEEICFSMGGRKMLYGQSYYSVAQFCDVYGHSSLAKAVYEKTCRPLLQSAKSQPPSWKEWIASWLL